MQRQIEVRLKRSRYYLGLLSVLLLASLAAIFLTRPDAIVLLAALIWTAYATWGAYQRHYLLSANTSIIAIRYRSSAWFLQTASGEWHAVKLLAASSTITARLVCLSFQWIEPPRHFSMLLKPTVCLFSDSSDPEHLRRLRVVLLSSASESIAPRPENGVFGHWR